MIGEAGEGNWYTEGVENVTIERFGEFIMEKGRELYRDMPWRRDTRPYYILVSELMLQQTQVERVIPKFENFVEKFPSETDLAKATVADVLMLWQGLGYNRRAKYLLNAAQYIHHKSGGTFPEERQDLLKLPGVGPNTAGAILAYAYNQPAIFIETNVRTVYIHHFFGATEEVTDALITELLEHTIDINNARRFYWALMDYGSWLKRSGVRNVGQSRHYTKQSALHGSLRQMRGRIITALSSGQLAPRSLEQAVVYDERFEPAIDGLLRDELIEFDGSYFRLAQHQLEDPSGSRR